MKNITLKSLKIQRLLIVSVCIVFCKCIYAQQWVLDEIADENEGTNPIDGMVGTILFLGLIYLVSKLFHKDNRKQADAYENEYSDDDYTYEDKDDSFYDDAENFNVENYEQKQTVETEKNNIATTTNPETQGESSISNLEKFEQKYKHIGEQTPMELYNMLKDSYAITSRTDDESLSAFNRNSNYSIDGKKYITRSGTIRLKEKGYGYENFVKEGTIVICDKAFDDDDYRLDEKYEIPNTVVAIGDGAFFLANPARIEIPSSVKYITGNPFMFPLCSLNVKSPYFVVRTNCMYDKSERILISCFANGKFDFPETLLFIGRHSFANLGINQIEIPSSVIGICEEAFMNNAIKNLFIPSNIQFVEKSAFEDCKYLETVEISASLTKIPENVFKNCANLRAIKLPPSITEIAENAFSGCNSLQAIYVPVDAFQTIEKFFDVSKKKILKKCNADFQIDLDILDESISYKSMPRRTISEEDKRKVLEYVNLCQISVISEDDEKDSIKDETQDIVDKNGNIKEFGKIFASYSRDGTKLLCFCDDNEGQYVVTILR